MNIIWCSPIIFIKPFEYRIFITTDFLSGNIEGMYELITKIPKISPKWPWPLNDPHFCKKMKIYIFKNSFLNFLSWNFTVRCIEKISVCCALQNWKIKISIELRAYFRKVEYACFSRKMRNFKFFGSKYFLLWRFD